MSTGAEGLRVIEVGDLGEAAGKLLADAGADVIRVEPPGGSALRRVGPFPGDRPDPAASLRWAHFNTSKRGVTLDLATEDGLALWRRLTADADAVIDAAGRGVLDALGAGWADASERCAGRPLAWCSVTPFGREGPWADWASNDLVQIALGGPMMSTGYDDHELPPIRGGYDHSLWMAGEFAAVAVLAALAGLEAGLAEGPELVDLSIHEAVSCTTEGAFPNWEYERKLVQRQTGRHSSPSPTPAWQFPSADGRYVNVIGGGLPRSEQGLDDLLAWMDRHGAAGDLADPRYREAIHSPQQPPSPERARFAEAVERFIAQLPAEDSYRGAQALHLPWAVVRRPEDNLDDPHWTDRGAFAEVDIPGRAEPARVPVAPYRFEGVSRQARRRAPLPGEHNREVYGGELGLSDAEILRMAQIGAI